MIDLLFFENCEVGTVSNKTMDNKVIIKCFVGGMNSGKTDKLIKVLDEAAYANEKILCVNPTLDNRRARTIFSKLKGKTKLRKYPLLTKASVKTVADLERAFSLDHFDVLGIDEAQLLGHNEKQGIPNTCQEFVNFIDQVAKDRAKKKEGLRIYIAGLDMYAVDGEPFEPMPSFLAIADEVHKLKSVCTLCGSKDAGYTQKLSGSAEKVEVGDTKGNQKMYTAVCRGCHTKYVEDS